MSNENDTIKLIRKFECENKKLNNMYNRWYSSFVKRVKIPYLPDAGLDKWLSSIHETHTDLNDVMKGGMNLRFKMNFLVEQEPLPLTVCKKLYHSNKHIEESLNFLGVGYNGITTPMIPCGLSKNAAGASKPRMMKISKWILLYFEKYTKSRILNPEEEMKILNVAIAEMGKEYSKYKNFQKKYTVIVAFDPIAFTKIGHYGEIDKNSCFSHLGSNRHHKFRLANARDSFVFLIKEGSNYISRQWGFYNKKANSFNLTNLYHSYVQDEVVKKINRKIFANILDKPEKEVFVTEGQITITSDIYHNRKNDWSFSTNEKLLEKQILY